ncbi:hypothetical protein K458DRAFT_257591, partial [Lentithecium fluviatile CBS 122367]
RNIFTDLDLWESEKAHDLESLFRHFDLPDAFVAERLNSVTHSYGVMASEEGTQYLWLHSLCKHIEVETELMGRFRARKIGTKHMLAKGSALRQELRQADYSWQRSAYLCKVESKSLPGDDSGQPSEGVDGVRDKRLTFICFGAPAILEKSFERLGQGGAWKRALCEPTTLFQVVFEALYQQLDSMAWRLSAVFADMEHVSLALVILGVDFLEMHTVAKSVVYLIEGAEAIAMTVENMLASYTLTASSQHSNQALVTIQELRYRRGLFQSTQLRLKSLEKRMSNVINLSFNLIAQHDNRIIQRDSTSMKTIAVATLLFLPTTTVATIFGTQFFDFGDAVDGGPRFRVSHWIWLFAVLSLVITSIVFVIW